MPRDARSRSPPSSRTRAARAGTPARSGVSPAKRAATPAAAAAGAAPAISRSAWLLVVVTYFAYVCMYCARKPFSAVKSVVETELSISTQHLANIDTALLTAYAVGQLSLGLAVRKLGRRWSLVLAFALAGGATAAFGLAEGPYTMIVLWGLAGVFAAPASPLFAILVAEAVPAAVRGTVLGIWSSCENLGGAVANLIAAGVLGRSGWRAVFFASGPIVAVWAPVLLLVLPTDAPAAAPPAVVVSAPGRSPAGRSGAKARAAAAGASAPPSALSIPGVGAVSLCYTLTKSARYCMMFWLPYFLSTYLHFDAPQAASMAAVLDIGGAVGAIFTGIACDSIYHGRTLRAAMHLCFATALCFVGWAAACVRPGTPPAVHVAFIGAIGFFVAGPGGVLGASGRGLVSYAGAAKDVALVSAVAGLVNGAGSVGAVLQGLLAPQLVSALGWPGLFGVLGIAMMGAAAVLRPAVAIEHAALSKLAKLAHKKAR